MKMTIEECYASIGGSYGDVRKRLPSEALVERFVLKFPEDKSYQRLEETLQQEDYEEAFKAVHTLKGVALNLGFVRLGRSSGELTELLRDKDAQQIDRAQCEELWKQVTEDYEQVMDAINCLCSNE